MRIENIRKKYGKKDVLKGVGFRAVPGTCVGILGINGSGKSTLLSILAGIQKRDGGIVIFATHDVQELPLCDKLYILKDGSLNDYEFDGDIHRLAGRL